MSAGVTNVIRALSVACVLIAAESRAQSPVGADAMTATAVADSQAVLREMDAAIKANKQNAAAWYRRGMVGWALYLRAVAAPPIKGLDADMMRRLADTSMIIAADIAPRNAEYQVNAGEYLRTATALGPRVKGAQLLERGYEVAKASGLTALHVRAAIMVGRQHWLSYEVNANQLGRMRCMHERADQIGSKPGVVCPSTPCYDMGATLDSAMQRFGDAGIGRTTVMATAGAKALHNMLIDCLSKRQPPEPGDYQRAEMLFREALSQSPTDDRAFRNLVMLLSERGRWRELASVARDRTTRLPDDPWAWLSRGLAEYRLSDNAALPTFEKGVALMPPRDRGRLFAFSKLLDRQDSIRYVATDSSNQTNRERTFWNWTDPLWSREGNDTRTEFLSRVVFAELRWSVEERGVRGADSDRGELYIRYGPPSAIGALRGCDFAEIPFECRGNTERVMAGGSDLSTSRPGYATIITFWDYDAQGIAFAFWGNPSYGTMKFPSVDGPHIASIVDARPVSFDNVAHERIIDIPTRLARFRATSDSVDLLMTLRAPVDSIRAANSVDIAPRLDLWILPREPGSGRDVHDSATVRGSGVGRFLYRLPGNEYFYRMEASADGSMTAARTMGWITAGRDTATGFATRGFGLSDLLLASELRVANAAPKRWTEFAVAPFLGSLVKGGTLQLLWENYELGARGGSADYQIEVILERDRRGAGGIAAEVVGVLAKVVGIQRDPNRVTYKFERVTAHASAIVDYVSLNLSSTPAGEYRVQVVVTDKTTGRRTSTVSRFTIRE